MICLCKLGRSTFGDSFCAAKQGAVPSNLLVFAQIAQIFADRFSLVSRSGDPAKDIRICCGRDHRGTLSHKDTSVCLRFTPFSSLKYSEFRRVDA